MWYNCQLTPSAITGGHILYKSTFEGPLRKLDWNCRPQKCQILDKKPAE